MSECVPFRLNKYISRTRFEGIMFFLRYTYRNDVEYYGGFFHMRQIEEVWKLNMDEEFNPSWINVLYKFMIEWCKKCMPRVMCVGSKPHPFGNERHTICCGLMSFLWRAQIVEGKY